MDEQVLDWIDAHRTALLDDVAMFLMYLGQSRLSALAVVLATLIVTLRTQRFGWGAGVCVAAVGALVVAAIGKGLIDRPRPPFEDALVDASGSSMPSSVALLCAAMGWAAVAGWEHPTRSGRRRATVIVGAVVLLFGAAVLYLGVHWLTDVLVGWALGVAVGAAAVPLGRRTADLLQRLLPGTFRWAARFDARPVGSDAVVHAQEP